MAQAQSYPPTGPPSQQIALMNEAVWIQIGMLISVGPRGPLADHSPPLAGGVQEMLGQLDDAIQCYEHALRANQRSIPAMNAISAILRTQEQFHKAVEYLNSILKLDSTNGDVWGSLGKADGSSACISSLTLQQDTAI
jgi:glucose repression mediator protein